MNNLTLFLAMIVGYLLGSIPFGLLLTRAAGLGDVRAIGSGNIGATNVLRTGRKGLAAATLLLDMGKGALAVLLGARLMGSGALDNGGAIAGTAAFIGHCFPVWLRFAGGKGVATGCGVFAALEPAALVIRLRRHAREIERGEGLGRVLKLALVVENRDARFPLDVERPAHQRQRPIPGGGDDPCSD